MLTGIQAAQSSDREATGTARLVIATFTLSQDLPSSYSDHTTDVPSHSPAREPSQTRTPHAPTCPSAVASEAVAEAAAAEAAVGAGAEAAAAESGAGAAAGRRGASLSAATRARCPHAPRYSWRER